MIPRLHGTTALRARLILAFSLIVTACSGKSPTTPNPVTPVWNLSGIISSSVGGGIASATVTVIDGPDAGKQNVADSAGRFALLGLQQGGFTVRASANGYRDVMRSFTLTAHTVSDFSLPRLPVAAFTGEGPITYLGRPDGNQDMRATGVNSGDGCAINVSGESVLRSNSNSFTLTYQWSLPPGMVLRPGDRFIYTIGVITRAQQDQFGSTGTYTTTFTFTSIACPG